MYHEERIIKGVLCWRSTPSGLWTQYTAAELTAKLQALLAREEVCDRWIWAEQ